MLSLLTGGQRAQAKVCLRAQRRVVRKLQSKRTLTFLHCEVISKDWREIKVALERNIAIITIITLITQLLL